MRIAPSSSALDRGLVEEDATLYTRAKVVPGLDVRVVLIDASQSIDKFHVLQGLEDPELEDGPERYFCFQRWGDTGGRGASRLDGPTTLPKVEAQIAQVFEEKTDEKWGSVEPGHEAKPGKYWLQHLMKPEAEARWEYFVSDGVDGKAEGWYPYLADAATEAEELYAQHVANGCNARTATRVIKSGHFSYEVDLEKMKQKNTRTNKVREIRRVFGATAGRRGRGGVPLTAAAKRAMKATAKAGMKAPKKAGPRAAAGAKRAVKKVAMKKVPVMKKAMKKKKPMKKAMKKVMKAMKKVSKIAKGRTRKHDVVSGKKVRTGGGLKATDIKKNKRGKLVSVKLSDRMVGNPWCEAMLAAREELGLTGFVLCGGKTEVGKRLYERTRELWLAIKAAKLPVAEAAPARVAEEGPAAE